MIATTGVLTRDYRLPLYQQLKEMFLEEIARGTWKIGSTIPSELEIAKKFSLSRATVRQAVTDLVQTGHLRRIQGKGTIVTEPKIEPLAALTSFSENMKAAGIVPTRRTLLVEWKVPTPEVAETLGQTGGEALYVERVLNGNGRPLALQRAWYPASLVDKHRDLFTKEYLDHHSMYETLQTQCGAMLHTAEETIDVGMPNKVEMKLLELRPGQPVMIIHRNTFDPFLRTIESVELLFRSDRYRYRVTLTRFAMKPKRAKPMQPSSGLGNGIRKRKAVLTT
jgi:GntR family transcriptional regulator, N-acetylglucosamine utilization regulator